MADTAAAPNGALTGRLIELTTGGPAAGGACVARLDDEPGGRVVFVRHALPGERVRARVTEDRGGAFCRADAVEILRASAARVDPPCEYARPERCGGCDWQHADGVAQRELKATLVHEQFSRLARLDVSTVFTGVEELPGGLLGWRSRVTYAVGRDARPGLRKHASHEIEHVHRCLIGASGVGDSPVLGERWPGLSGVEVVQGSDGVATVLSHRPGPGRQARGRRPPDRVEVVSGPPALTHEVDGRRFEVAAGGFWQGHPGAAHALGTALLDALAPRPGETVLDLYAGAGAFTAGLARAVGPTGRVLGLESDAAAVADAARNLADLPWAVVRQSRVDGRVADRVAAELTAARVEGAGAGVDAVDAVVDVVVLDPPRAGAGRQTMAALLDLAPRAIGYVSCDPATLARDVAVACSAGWQLASLRAFDAFPMTQHVECLAVLEPKVLR